MKRYHGLYDSITSFDNLYLAYRLTAKGSTASPARIICSAASMAFSGKIWRYVYCSAFHIPHC